MGVPVQEVYLEDTSKYNSKLIYFTHVKNIHWLVYQKIEELSFNSGVKHEKLVSPTERILVHNLHHFIKPTTCFAKYTYINNLDAQSTYQICMFITLWLQSKLFHYLNKEICPP